MRAIVEKIDDQMTKSEFTIIGYDEDDIDNQVYELEEWARRDSTYPSARYSVKQYIK